jgi:hypothetical protein
MTIHEFCASTNLTDKQVYTFRDAGLIRPDMPADQVEFARLVKALNQKGNQAEPDCAHCDRRSQLRGVCRLRRTRATALPERCGGNRRDRQGERRLLCSRSLRYSHGAALSSSRRIGFGRLHFLHQMPRAL